MHNVNFAPYVPFKSDLISPQASRNSLLHFWSKTLDRTVFKSSSICKTCISVGLTYTVYKQSVFYGTDFIVIKKKTFIFEGSVGENITLIW